MLLVAISVVNSAQTALGDAVRPDGGWPAWSAL